ncbi:MAG TPA: MCP four helix bundle domain-containing protein, partial [Bdellovibrionales bacterium]|nr:MCP four helix bundle domain-containing protein [Bdellovibrionales bacterium]
MFETWSLRKKLLTSFALTSAFLLAVGGFGFYQLQSVVGVYSKIADTNMPNLINIYSLRVSANRIATELANLRQEDLSAQEYAAIKKNIEAEHGKIEERVKEYLALEFFPGEEAIWKDVEKELNISLATSVKLVADSADLTRDPNKQAAKNVAIDEYFVQLGTLIKNLSVLCDFHRAEAKASSETAVTSANRASLLSTIFVVIGLCASMILGLVLAKSLSTILMNLTARLSSGADEVASAATQISSTSEELSSATTEQAAALQETAASVEEMSAMIKKSADNSSSANDLSQSSRQAAQRGKTTVEEMITAINE